MSVSKFFDGTTSKGAVLKHSARVGQNQKPAGWIRLTQTKAETRSLRDSVPADSSIESTEMNNWNQTTLQQYLFTLAGWFEHLSANLCMKIKETKLACAGDRGEERPEKNWKLQPVCFHLSQKHPEWPSRPLVFCISMPHFLRASRQRPWIPTILFQLHLHAQWERERERRVITCDDWDDGVTPFYFSSFWIKLWVCGCIWTCTLPHPH